MKGLSIFSWFSYPLPLQERLELIKNAGFDATALWWGDEFEDKNRQPEMTRRLGLEIDYVHAPADNPNALWLDNIDGDSYLNQLLSCIEDCRRHDIPTAVIHVTRLSSRPPVTQLGIDRIKRLVDLAEQKQVNWRLKILTASAILIISIRNCSPTAWVFAMTAGTKTIITPRPIACPVTGTNYLPYILMITGEMTIPICFPMTAILIGIL